MNPTLEKLEKLRLSFQPYSEFWEEWTQYKLNELNTFDIYVINIFREKDFNINIEDLLMFYFRRNVIDNISGKLQASRHTHALWLVKQWQRSLCEVALENDFETFYTSKIDKLNLIEDFKIILKEFAFDTLRALLRNYSDEDFTNDFLLEKIKRFLILHKNLKSKPIYYRREVKQSIQKKT